ncbi:hypothetical protein ABE437_04420 [Isoptericola cucumis]|uniref:hypothetical protein n=1 Tax=Isoptericola cucumis TaxID=1776856 RepID=UPI00320812BC
MTTGTPPSRRRPTWPELPAPVRAAIEARLGAPVTGWTSHDGGYSPGLASTLRTDGGAVFVKAVGVSHEFAATLYRQEARRSALLPRGVPAPRARWLLDVPTDDGAWVAVASDAVAGRTPTSPLRGRDLDAVAELALRVGEHEVAPGVLPEVADELPTSCTATLAAERPAGLATLDPWFTTHLDRLAGLERHAPEAVAGTRLVHGDLRADNTLLVEQAPDGGRAAGAGPAALAVDWAYPARGAAFCDLVGMLPATQAEGGPAPEDVLARHPLPHGTDEDAVTAYLVALTGYFVHSSLQPPPPGIPHVRAFQRVQGEAGVAWLRRRLGG